MDRPGGQGAGRRRGARGPDPVLSQGVSPQADHADQGRRSRDARDSDAAGRFSGCRDPDAQGAPAPEASQGDRKPDPERPSGPSPREAKANPTRAIRLQLLLRRGVRDEARREAIADLSKIDAKPEVMVLLEAIKALDDRPGAEDDGVDYDLGRILTARDSAELSDHLWSFEDLTKVGKKPITRQLGFLAMIAAGRVDGAWALALKDVRSLRDLVDAMPAIRDPAVRASLYPRVLPLLEGLPKESAAGRRRPGRSKVDTSGSS